MSSDKPKPEVPGNKDDQSNTEYESKDHAENGIHIGKPSTSSMSIPRMCNFILSVFIYFSKRLLYAFL